MSSIGNYCNDCNVSSFFDQLFGALRDGDLERLQSLLIDMMMAEGDDLRSGPKGDDRFRRFMALFLEACKACGVKGTVSISFVEAIGNHISAFCDGPMTVHGLDEATIIFAFSIAIENQNEKLIIYRG